MIANRILTVFCLLAFFAGLAEPHLGAARDGEVHHEDGVSALTHSVERGDHGHEDAGSREREHGGDHEHGTSADHCTHVHSSVALQQSFALDLPSAVAASDFSVSVMETEPASHPPIRPPIA